MPVDAKLERAERTIVHAALGTTAVAPQQFPVSDRVEVAFVGKSNVGKSSMINAMLNRKALVRTSQAPGKTRTINFFEVESDWFFVDLPGYGYARISRAESEKWGKMIESYLKNRPQLVALVLLLDIRHAPSANDRLIYEWCRHYKLPVILAATKSDKLKRSQIQKHVAVLRKGIAESLAAPAPEPIIAFSSTSRAGREILWETLDEYAKRGRAHAME